MIKSLLLIVFLFSASFINAQTYSVRKKQKMEKYANIKVDVDSAFNNPVYRAGYSLRKSANAQISGICCTAAASLFATIAITTDKKIMLAPAGVFAVGAIVSGIMSISYKMDAGRELMISANSIRFHF